MLKINTDNNTNTELKLKPTFFSLLQGYFININ